jgi:hypothetical protein
MGPEIINKEGGDFSPPWDEAITAWNKRVM